MVDTFVANTVLAVPIPIDMGCMVRCSRTEAVVVALVGFCCPFLVFVEVAAVQACFLRLCLLSFCSLLWVVLAPVTFRRPLLHLLTGRLLFWFSFPGSFPALRLSRSVCSGCLNVGFCFGLALSFLYSCLMNFHRPLVAAEDASPSSCDSVECPDVCVGGCRSLLALELPSLRFGRGFGAGVDVVGCLSPGLDAFPSAAESITSSDEVSTLFSLLLFLRGPRVRSVLCLGFGFACEKLRPPACRLNFFNPFLLKGREILDGFECRIDSL